MVNTHSYGGVCFALLSREVAPASNDFQTRGTCSIALKTPAASFLPDAFMRQLEWGMHQNGSYLLNKAISKIHRVPASKQVLERETSAGYVAQTDAAPAKGASPLQGQQIGHYTLIRQLGQGGYASVFLGEHHYLNTYVALQLLNLYLAR